ncbi:MAG: hypothetical protein HW380_3743 [Magnetococcales bacterium]|nr:hypothetical protein [Magnetococcales bacterium]HIJ85948.1 hypothetical protein [Magnetococcales bacterium]
MENLVKSLVFILFILFSFFSPILAASLDQDPVVLPPSPDAAMASALQKSREAMNKARLLDQQRKSQWIQAQETLRQTRKLAEQHKQRGENAWSDGTMGREDMEQALIEGEEAAKKADALEQQAKQQQTRHRAQIRKILREADFAAKTAQIIHQSWVESYGQQALEAARNLRQHLQHATEISQLRILEVQTMLGKLKEGLQEAEKELEHIRQTQKESRETVARALQADQQSLREEVKRTDNHWSMATSHEDLADSLDHKEQLDQRVASLLQQKSAMDAQFKTQLDRQSTKIAQFKGEIGSQEDRLRKMREQSTSLLLQARAQSQHADSLARLADASWPLENSTPECCLLNDTQKPEPPSQPH